MKKIDKEYNYTLEDIRNFFIKYPKLIKINKGIVQKKMPIYFNTKLDWSKKWKTKSRLQFISQNHNYEKFVKKSIESVLSQTYKNFELIIIDDGSSDNSRKIIQEYENNPKVIVIFQKQKGLNISNNVAIRLAKGEYILH